jgi:hypothetical protein
MKHFKQYIEESFQSGRPKNTRSKSEEMEIAKQSPIYKKATYNGWKIDVSVHAAAQAFDRRPDFEYDDWMKLHQRAIDSFSKNKVDGEYIYFSKSLDQGYVVAMSGRAKSMRIITVLPKGRSNPKPGTKQMMVEGVEIEILETIFVD